MVGAQNANKRLLLRRRTLIQELIWRTCKALEQILEGEIDGERKVREK